MKHFHKIILSIIGVILLAGSIAFAETGHFLFGFIMVVLTFVSCGVVASLFEEIKAYEKLTEAYKGAEEIYKDSLKNAREHNEKLNEFVANTLKYMEQMSGAQVELNDFLKETLTARRIDNRVIAAGYEELQKKISRSMKTNARKR